MTSLRVIGPPRSGTNFVKFLIDNNTTITSGFHVGWWKHAVIPPLMSGAHANPDDVFSIIMYRDLVTQMASFWRFCQKGGGAIMSDAEDFTSFLRQPIYMNPHTEMVLYFDTPLSYIAQFYFAAAGHTGEKVFLKLEDVQAEPQLVFEALSASQKFQSTDRPDVILNPDGYLGRNPDRHLSGNAVFDRSGSLEDKMKTAEANLTTIDQGDIAFIMASNAQSIIDQFLKPSA